MTLDPLTFSLIGPAIRAIPDEMLTNLIRTGYSTAIREARDGSTGLLSASGELIAQGDSIPVQLTALREAYRGCARALDLTQIGPKHILITNHPYFGASHVPDVTILTPVFHNARLIAWAGSTAHMTDIGSGAPGSADASATDIFGEGFLIPPTIAELEDDFTETHLWPMLRANVREPDKSVGDLNAQLAANRTGVGRFLELIAKYGPSDVFASMAELLDYSERMMLRQIEQFPVGRFTGDEVLEDAGLAGGPIRIHVAVERVGSEIIVDYTGTGHQVRGIINCSLTSTKAAAYQAIRSVLLGGLDVPVNEGSNRPIRLVVPEGSVLNPTPPAPVRARLNGALRAFGATMRALSQALPERVIASGTDTTLVPQLSYLSKAGWQVMLDPLGGGFGASNWNDGATQCRNPLDNTGNTPVEALEHEYDYVRIRRYELVEDSAGAGRHRGAQGMIKEYEILRDGVKLTGFSDRHEHGPWPLFGAREGTPNAWKVFRNGQEISLPTLISLELCAGDRLQIIAGGAAGYGDPRDRDRERVARDLREGRISAQAALEIYGLDAQVVG